MQTKERTFLEIAKRFTKPYLEDKVVTLKSFVFYSIWAIAPLMHVFFAQKITETIEDKNKETFIIIIIIYSIFVILNYILAFYTRTWWYLGTVNIFRKPIHNYYLDEFVKLSNTKTEKFWTGKLVSIIGTGWILGLCF